MKIKSQDEPKRCGTGGREWVGAAVRWARIVARRCWRVSRVPGGVVAVEEAQVQGLRSRILHVAVLAGAAVHLARGDEAAVAWHLHKPQSSLEKEGEVGAGGELGRDGGRVDRYNKQLSLLGNVLPSLVPYHRRMVCRCLICYIR